MANNDKKIVDGVSKPGTTPPDSSSKPLIVSHKPMIKDSTVTDDSAEDSKTEVLAEQKSSSGSKVIEPLSEDSKEPTEDASETTEQEPDEEEPKDSEILSEDSEKNSDDETIIDTVVGQNETKNKDKKRDEQEQKRVTEIENNIESKKYFVKVKAPKKKRNKRAMLITLLVVFLSLVGVGLAADAELINLPFDLPFDFIKKSQPAEQPVPQATNSSQNNDKKSDETAKAEEYVVPEGYVVYENKDLGFKFAYPETWGEATTGPSEESAHLIKGSEFKITFSNNLKVTVGGLSSDREHDPNGGHGGFVYAGAFADGRFKPTENQATIVTKDNNSELYSLVFLAENCVGAGSVLIKNLGDTAKYPYVAFMYQDYKIDPTGPVTDVEDCTLTSHQQYISVENIETLKQINSSIQTID